MMLNLLNILGAGIVYCGKLLFVLAITCAVLFPLIHGMNWLEHRFVRPRPEFTSRAPAVTPAPTARGNTAELQRRANSLRSEIATFWQSAQFNRSMAMQWQAESRRPGQGLYNEASKVSECLADAARAEQRARQLSAQLQAIEAELARRR